MRDKQAAGCTAVAATLSLGGNVGDVAAAFAAALAALAADPQVEVAACSSVYRTPPWGKADQPPFLNMATLLQTTLSARGLLDLCLSIEKRLGRERRERWGPRTIDIDLLLYGNLTIDEPGLTVPHARIAERAFVLVPLAEIAPDLRIGRSTVGELLARADARGIAIDAAATRRMGTPVASVMAGHIPNGKPA